MRRATRWLLGLPDPVPVQEDQLPPIEAVHVEVPARQALMRLIDARGRWQGGALFGTRLEGILRVSLVTTLGPPGWTSQPLTPSMPYLIGVSDAVASLLSETVDWAGHWTAAPDGRLPDRRDDLLWLTLGARRGFFDERHPLVVVGLQDGYLAGRAYIWDEGAPVEVTCSLGPPIQR